MGTRIRTHITPKMRIISFVLAFVMVFVGLPYMGGNIGVHAAPITTGSKFSDYMTKGMVGSTSHDGYSVSKANLGNESTTEATFSYEYTGKVKSTKVNLYDYLSDTEISGGTPESMYTNYGCEPFDSLNMAISDHSATSTTTTTTCNAEDNITITYTPGTSGISSNIHVYLFDDSTNNGWPGPAMEYDNDNSCWTYTFSREDVNSGEHYLNFTPLHLIFNDGNGGSGHQTATINAQLTKGYTYSFEGEVQLKSNPDNIGLIFNSGTNT